MALDAKDLQQVAALLGEALGPKIREAVAEQVTTRLEAALLQVHERFDSALSTLKGEVATSLEETAGLLAMVTASLNTLHEQVRGYHDEHLASLGAVTKRTDELAEGLGAFATKEQVLRLREHMHEEGLATDQVIQEVRASIPKMPEIPAPVSLVEGGELSPAMRAALDIATKQVFAPMLGAATQAAQEHAAGLTAQALRDATAAGAAIDELNVKRLGEFTTKLGEYVDATRLQLQAVGERLTAAVREAHDHAESVRTHVLEAVTKGDAALAALNAEHLGSITAKLAAHVAGTNAQLQHVEERLAESTASALKAADEASTLALKQAIEFASNSDSDLAEQLRASAASGIEELNAAVDSQIRSASTALSAQLTQVEERVTSVREQITDDAASMGEKFASVSLKLDGLAQDVANAGASAVAVAQKATSDMVTEIVEEAVKEAKRVSAELVQGALPAIRAESDEVAKRAATEAVPDLVAAALPTPFAITAAATSAAEATAAKVATEAGNATLVAARAAAEATAEAFAQRAAAEVTQTAQTAVTTAVDAMRASLTEELDPAPLVSKAVAAALPQVVSGAAEAAQERCTDVLREMREEIDGSINVSFATLRAGLVEELDPAPLVEAQFSAVLPKLAKTSADAASEACALAVERAKDGINAAWATTIDTMRTGLVEELNPAPLVEAQVKEMVPTVVRQEVSQELKAALRDELPRIEVNLEAKLNAAVDRIPKPRDGKDGVDGRDGADGLDGLDARFAQPLPYEAGKAYEYGAWVTHDSGVWVAARRQVSTAPGESNDWDCVLPGVKSVRTSMLEDGRTVHMTCILSDGSTHEDTFHLDIPIVRGVYDEKREYGKDDICTFDGSWWVAQKSGVLPRPGSEGTAWRLTVKRGKDGKDLKQPAPQVIRHVGEWEPDVEYPVNTTVDHAGVRWLAMRSNRERPPFVTLVSNDTWTKLGT